LAEPKSGPAGVGLGELVDRRLSSMPWQPSRQTTPWGASNTA